MGRSLAGARPLHAETGRDQDAPGLSDLGLTIDRRLSVADQVHATLHDAIVSTRLMPGTAISENSICRQFNVSRTPVRAAIQKLSEEGLVDVYPQLGSYVSRVDMASIRDSHFVRKSIEISLMREVAPAWTPQMSRAVRDVIDAQERVIEAGDVEGFFEQDEAFHHLFAVFAGREGVWPTVLAAKRPLMRFMRLAGRPERLPVVPSEHLAIVEALDLGALDHAEKALADHLDKNFVLFDSLPGEERARFIA